MRYFYIQTYPITLIALGPLTNIALLISTFPEVKDHIREIVLMGEVQDEVM